MTREGSRRARHYDDHLLVKEPGTRQRTPLHQVQPYHNIEGRQNISMWIAGDPVPREPTLEFVAGSHLGQWLMPSSFMDQQVKWYPVGGLADLPDIESDRSQLPIVGWDVESGNARLERQSDTHQARSDCSSAMPTSRQPDPASRAIDSGRSGKPSKPK